MASLCTGKNKHKAIKLTGTARLKFKDTRSLHAEKLKLSGNNLPIGHSIKQPPPVIKMELKDTLQVRITIAHQNTNESTITAIAIR